MTRENRARTAVDNVAAAVQTGLTTLLQRQVLDGLRGVLLTYFWDRG